MNTDKNGEESYIASRAESLSISTAHSQLVGYSHPYSSEYITICSLVKMGTIELAEAYRVYELLLSRDVESWRLARELVQHYVNTYNQNHTHDYQK